jgi:cyclopropane fatty-acyl-phospholipid synthase-like methyltransferase
MRFIKRTLKKFFFKSGEYWEKRYKKGGNSGAGSYNELAQGKSNFINEFIQEHGVKRLLDYGCGDGNQLGYFKVEHYLGVDVSQTAVAICREKHKNRANTAFLLYDPRTFQSDAARFAPDLTISMDVIFHLVEDAVFANYIRELFGSSKKYVVIYSTNIDRKDEGIHHVDRSFTKYVSDHITDWKLVKRVENPHKHKDTNCDYFIYARKG